MNISPINYKDSYKLDHIAQYEPGTTKIYSNFTPRSSRIEGVNHVVVFGIQYLIREYLMKQFNMNFFALPRALAVSQYKERIDWMIGPDAINVDHIADLHALGYLPIHIKALKEGSLCPIGVPCLTITNTDPRFAWLPGSLEDLISNTLWPMMTSATTANRFRNLFARYAAVTSDMPEFATYQAHDFSMRGMFGMEAAVMSGMAHLLSSGGTDCVPAIDGLIQYYDANVRYDNIGGSIPATEHSVMCTSGQADEIGTFRRLITDVYPKGNVSIVADSWNYDRVLDEYLPALKAEIMARDGKVVIRPDSGDPVDITIYTVRKLWEIFGGTTNSKGYKQLDSHIGMIYGDGITYERAQSILKRLNSMGFASTNVVLGLGSYTYQGVTRDTFGWAMKATYAEVNGERRELFKAPKADSTKRSAKGLLQVVNAGSEYRLNQSVSEDQEANSCLRTVFRNGQPTEFQQFSTIRDRLALQRVHTVQPEVAA